MISSLKIVKTRNVKTPSRGTSVAAGLDFFVPEDLTKEDMDAMFAKTGHTLKYEIGENGFVTEMTVEWGQSACIPSGIKADIPHGYCMEFHNKSGIGLKKGLIAGACVTGDTLIETNCGKFPANVLTKEFCEQNKILIKSWNLKDKQFEFKHCCGFKPSKTSTCIHVVFEDGTEISGAEDHLVYDKDENRWVPLKNFL